MSNNKDSEKSNLDPEFSELSQLQSSYNNTAKTKKVELPAEHAALITDTINKIHMEIASSNTDDAKCDHINLYAKVLSTALSKTTEQTKQQYFQQYQEQHAESIIEFTENIPGNLTLPAIIQDLITPIVINFTHDFDKNPIHPYVDIKDVEFEEVNDSDIDDEINKVKWRQKFSHNSDESSESEDNNDNSATSYKTTPSIKKILNEKESIIDSNQGIKSELKKLTHQAPVKINPIHKAAFIADSEENEQTSHHQPK